MKKLRRIIIAVLFVAGFTALQAQGPGDPPPPPSGHGSGSHQNPGGGAPLGGGTLILVAAGFAYALKKVIRKKSVKHFN